MSQSKSSSKKLSLQRLFEIVFAFVLAMLFIGWYFGEKEDFENLALGEGTLPYFASDGNYPIHIDEVNKNAFDSLIFGWEERGKKDVILCLGNSQTHSINQLKSGEVNYSQLLFNEYKPKGYDVITHSIPNCNLQEFYLFTEFWKKHLPVKVILLPTFMDDTRENNINTIYLPYLSETKFNLENDNTLVQKINTALNTGTDEGEADMAALKQTTQERSELFLNGWLNDNFYPWSNRPNVRGAFFNWLYTFRNTLFGIGAQTKRKLIKNSYDDNLKAIEVLYQAATKDNISIISYIPPIRNDVEVPYVLSEYDQFKKDIETKSAEYENVHFINIEDIVPAHYWGTKGSTNLTGEQELDFMHFQYQGHINLFNALKSELDKLTADS